MEGWFLAVVGCVVTYMAAKSRGRSGWWWLLGWLGLVFVLVLPSQLRDPEAPNPETHVRCPDCRELVRHDARKCKHCGAALVPVEGSNEASQYGGLSTLEVAVAMKDAARDGDAAKMVLLLRQRPGKQAVEDARVLADLHRRQEVLALLDGYVA